MLGGTSGDIRAQMAVNVKTAIALLEGGASARVVGDPGGMFCIAIHADEKIDMIGDDDMRHPRMYPSLNHAADWLRRIGITKFSVDVSNWKKSDTGRERSAGRP